MTDAFHGTRGRTVKPEIMLIGEAYGEHEARANRPFVGSAGKLLSDLLRRSGWREDTLLFTNVINKRPARNDMRSFLVSTKQASPLHTFQRLYVTPELRTSVATLEKQIEIAKPKRIVCLGNYPFWALFPDLVKINNSGGYKTPSGIMQWRGSQLRYKGIPVMPTIHPAAAMRQWPLTYTVLHDLSNRLRREWRPPDYVFKIAPTYREVIERLEFLEREYSGPISVDIETYNPAHIIACIGLAWSTTHAICIPITIPKNGGYEMSWSEEEYLEIVFRLRRLLATREIIGQNFLYDAQYLAHWMLAMPNITYDTRIMHHLLYPGTPQSLAHLSSLYCSYHVFWKDEGKYLTGDSLEDGWSYNCKDCVITYECHLRLKELIADAGMTELYDEQREQLMMLLRMMLRGIRVDRSARMQAASKLHEAKKQYEQWLEAIIPPELLVQTKTPWYRSPKQTASLLYDELGYKEIMRPRNKSERSRTTDDAALFELGLRDPLLRVITTALQEYRSICRFIDFTTQEIDSDNRIRCSYSPTTETFRYSSSTNVFGTGGNLQNLPKGDEDDESI